MSNQKQKPWLPVVIGAIITPMILYFFYAAFFSPAPLPPPLPPDDGCEVPSIVYRCGSEEIERSTNAAFENEFLVAAKSDLKILKGKGELSNLTNIRSLYEEKREGQFCVSEAFFEAYQSKRNAICSYLALLKDTGLVMSTQGRLKAEANLVNIIDELSKIVENQDVKKDSITLEAQLKDKIDAAKGKLAQLEEDAKRVREANKLLSDALLENCRLIIQFMEGNIKQLKSHEIDEAYFWKRQKELDDKIDGYKVDMKALLNIDN
ncbi:MAG: hypothetical protein ACKV1O_05660 [Saprospiraceae bacterium]